MGENPSSPVAAPGAQGFEKRQLSPYSWDQRIQRAQELAQTCASAAEILQFYARLLAFQKSLYEAFAAVPAPPLTAPPQSLLPRYPDFLQFVSSTAPEPLADAAREMKQSGPDRWAALLAGGNPGLQPGDIDVPGDGALAPALTAEENFLALAYLQPYAEFVSRGDEAGPASGSPSGASPVCPVCGAEPVCGVLRPEGYGARRSLVCSLCSREWDFPRAVCSACNEQRAQALGVFTSQDFEHIRVEGCDTCKHYIKTVDLTKNGRAVPVVDELASVSLGLWAREKGYTKLQPNLFGL